MSQPKKRTTICEAAVLAATFNANRTQLAFCPNNDTVVILAVDLAKDCTEWSVLHTLRGHDQTVSGISWCPVNNRLLTCALDRTAFVWAQEAGENAKPSDRWEKQTVLLDTQMKSGFTACSWSLSGNKIYVSCATDAFAVGKYDPTCDWWRCMAFETHCSAVTALAPSPACDTLLATGSTDQTVKMVSTFTKSIDDAASRLDKCGAELAVFDVGGWVNALAWNSEGTSLAVAAHDSTVTVFYGASPTDFSQWGSQLIRLRQLPLRSLAFVADDVLAGAGFDFYPLVFGLKDGQEGGWTLTHTGAMAKKEQQETLSAAALARQKFINQADLGMKGTEALTLPETRHSSTVNSVVKAGKGKFITASSDGRIEVWSLSALEPVAATPAA